MIIFFYFTSTFFLIDQIFFLFLINICNIKFLKYIRLLYYKYKFKNKLFEITFLVSIFDNIYIFTLKNC